MSGLLAAKACRDRDIESVVIASEVPRVPRTGAHCLYDRCGLDIPGVTLTYHIASWDDSRISHEQIAEAYRAKTGGDESIGKFSSFSEVYSWAEAMAELLPPVVPTFRRAEVFHTDLNKLLHVYDNIIITTPLPQMFERSRELCESRMVWATPGKPDNLSDTLQGMSEVVVYNPDPADDWYRYSKVFGHETTEWVKQVPGSRAVKKVANVVHENMLTVYASDRRIIFAGRNAEWNKNRLAHEVYYNVCSMFNGISSSTMTA